MPIKVLCICKEVIHNIKRHNYPVAEFVYEQNTSLSKLNFQIDYYLIKKNGFLGYLSEIVKLRVYLKSVAYKYDIIHAHGGHIGIIANSQRKIPVVTTYHGSDINYINNRLISIITILLSKKNIFVSKKLLDKVKLAPRATVIPCGVDLNLFRPLDKEYCRKELGFKLEEKIILFAGNRNNRIKNYSLAESAINLIGTGVKLIELNSFNRNQMNLLLNAADLLLLTSLSEGSPQIIKEAMACNCPIVATDVGDVKEIISNTYGCYIAHFSSKDLANKIKLALQFNRRTNGRDAILKLDNDLVAQKISDVYLEVLNIRN